MTFDILEIEITRVNIQLLTVYFLYAKIELSIIRHRWILTWSEANRKCCCVTRNYWSMYDGFGLLFEFILPLLLIANGLTFQKSIGLPDIHSGYGFAIGIPHVYM